MIDSDRRRPRSEHLCALAPWVLAFVAVAPAFWLVLVPETGRDSEFPRVERRTYSEFPPVSYRWAEPGDTLDKLGLYVAAAGLIVSGLGWRLALRGGRSARLWPAAACLFAAAGWHASTPWPTPDGWHGLNWHAALDAAAPLPLRLALSGAALLLIGVTAVSVGRSWTRINVRDPLPWIGGVLLGLRFAPAFVPGPPGYWERWALAWGLVLLAATAWKRLTPPERSTRWPVWMVSAIGLWLAICVGGRWLIWYQRPLDRLREVEAGKIYLSAMPSYRGLELATRRHGFKTIINVFNEHGPLRSPRLPEELRFVREHGLRYVGSPGDPLLAEAFLDETLRLSQDPDAWPILVHCHGSMDRSPAWMGIYRFLVEGRPLDEILREIEAHRGLRPKASVTLLYNRILPARAPERHAADPTARELLRNAHGTVDPFLTELETARRRANGSEPLRVGQMGRTDVRRP